MMPSVSWTPDLTILKTKYHPFMFVHRHPRPSTGPPRSLFNVAVAQEGAEGFLKVQYTAIAKIAVFLMAFIVLSYVMRPPGSSDMQNTGVGRIGNATLGFISGGCFFVGALCSAAAGYISMWVLVTLRLSFCSWSWAEGGASGTRLAHRLQQTLACLPVTL